MRRHDRATAEQGKATMTPAADAGPTTFACIDW
jgi:hypothetical protein